MVEAKKGASIRVETVWASAACMRALLRIGAKCCSQAHLGNRSIGCKLKPREGLAAAGLDGFFRVQASLDEPDCGRFGLAEAGHCTPCSRPRACFSSYANGDATGGSGGARNGNPGVRADSRMSQVGMENASFTREKRTN